MSTTSQTISKRANMFHIRETIASAPAPQGAPQTNMRLEVVGNVERNTQIGREGSTPRRDRRIEMVVLLLENNSHQQIPIAEMARLVNLSVGRLAHLFKSEMDVSIQQYLTKIRLAKAKSELESCFLSIKEIAASVGFSSVTRFAAYFKSVFGATPAQYRKRFPPLPYHRAGKSL